MGATYDLMRGSTCVGRLRPTDVDQPWFRLAFEATAAFEPLRPLFAAEVELLERSDDFDWEASERAYQRIEELGLRLVPQDGGPAIDEFLLHIDGDVAWFRY